MGNIGITVLVVIFIVIVVFCYMFNFMFNLIHELRIEVDSYGTKVRDLECDLENHKLALQLKEFNSLSTEEKEKERKEVERLFTEFGLQSHYKNFASYCKGIYTAENARKYIKGSGILCSFIK